MSVKELPQSTGGRSQVKTPQPENQAAMPSRSTGPPHQQTPTPEFPKTGQPAGCGSRNRRSETDQTRIHIFESIQVSEHKPKFFGVPPLDRPESAAAQPLSSCANMPPRWPAGTGFRGPLTSPKFVRRARCVPVRAEMAHCNSPTTGPRAVKAGVKLITMSLCKSSPLYLLPIKKK